ncbi:tail fiber/spike domain-containing protein [Ewingella americana]
MDSFEDGAELTVPNQVLRYKATGEYYRWDVELPKAFTESSTPNSSDGIGTGKWLSVGDATLRTDLAKDSCADIPHFKQQGISGTVNAAISKRFNKKLDAIADFGADPTGQNDSYAQLQ